MNTPSAPPAIQSPASISIPREELSAITDLDEPDQPVEEVASRILNKVLAMSKSNRFALLYPLVCRALFTARRNEVHQLEQSVSFRDQARNDSHLAAVTERSSQAVNPVEQRRDLLKSRVMIPQNGWLEVGEVTAEMWRLRAAYLRRLAAGNLETAKWCETTADTLDENDVLCLNDLPHSIGHTISNLASNGEDIL